MSLTTLGINVLAIVGRMPARRRFGAMLGLAALLFMRRRRQVADKNLQAAMPELSAAARRQLLRRHFTALGESFMDMLWGLTADKTAICRNIRLPNAAQPPYILVAPHFLGLELTLLRIGASTSAPCFYHYKPMHNAFWDALILRLRGRFGAVGLPTSSRTSLLAGARRLRDGGILCYLPDIDPKRRKSTVFVPFMAVPRAATTAGLSRLAHITKKPVVMTIICREKDGYTVRQLPPLQQLSANNDALADATLVNNIIAEWVRKMPENYYWLHRRFKTTATGDKPIY